MCRPPVVVFIARRLPPPVWMSHAWQMGCCTTWIAARGPCRGMPHFQHQSNLPTAVPQVFIGSALVPFFSSYTSKFKKAQQVAAEEAAQVAAVAALEGGAGGQAGSGKLGSSAGEAGEAGTPDGSSSDSEHTPGTGKLSAAESAQSLADQSAAQQAQQGEQQAEQQQAGAAAVGPQATRRGLSKRFQTWKNWWI